MALPKLASAKYELTLPSNGKKVEFRPFLVKEEKLLLMAQSAGAETDQIRAIKDIIHNCTFDSVDANTLPFFDLEYVFLQIRAKSIGEKAKIQVTCPDDGVTKVEVEVNLGEVKCVNNVEHSDKIELGDGIGIMMKYPKIDVMTQAGDDANSAFNVIKGCIASIYDNENVTDRKDMDEKELDTFIESMTHQQFEDMNNFFITMPRVKEEVSVKNPNTGVESKVVLEGMASFF
jgi:hypothetical protein